jgi:hypothetical protein
MNEITPAGYNLTAKKFIPGITWFLVVMVLLFTPGNDLPEVGDWFARINFDKFIHMGVFGLLTFLFMFPIGLVQKYFIPGRSFDLLDWAADSIGAAVAWLFCRKVYLKQAHSG